MEAKRFRRGLSRLGGMQGECGLSRIWNHLPFRFIQIYFANSTRPRLLCYFHVTMIRQYVPEVYTDNLK
jgi:hypothetical protein